MTRWLMAILLLAAPAFAEAQAARHGSHAAQHGGQFMSLWNDTLHVEGVWQEQRRFRLYIYDASSRAMPPAVLNQFRGAVVDDNDTPIAPLRLSADGSHLEGRIASLPLPAVIAFQLTRPEGGEPERIGMMFTAHTVEPPSFEVPPTPIPATVKEIGAALLERAGEAIRLAESGNSGEVYRPAIQTRDLLLGLSDHVHELPAARRAAADAAIAETLRVAWLLHLAGDVGSPVQVSVSAQELRLVLDVLSVAFEGFFNHLK